MTDEMRAREKAICEAAKVNDIGEVSDGYHTFNGLYEQRMILFATLVKAHKDKAWKSYKHEDGEYCFSGGWFIVGIDTPKGSYTYHYENKYWDMFDCVELPKAKHWDGHTESDAETRLMSLEDLPTAEPRWIPVKFRPMDSEEHEYWEEQFGEELADEDAVMFDCPMPEDGQEILVSYRKWISMDKCEIDGGCYGLEGNGDWEDVIAWMPLPEPYKEE